MRFSYNGDHGPTVIPNFHCPFAFLEFFSDTLCAMIIERECFVIDLCRSLRGPPAITDSPAIGKRIRTEVRLVIRLQ